MLTLSPGIGTLERMSSPAALPVPVTPAARGWTPQPLPVEAPKSYIGARLGGRYLLRRRIGAGGMSTVYEALDSTLGKRVAVKILRDDLPSDPVDRFRREAHVLAGLTHEHIAGIIDRQDLKNGPRFLVSAYIDGHDLGELCGRGPMPAAVVTQIGLQVAAALAYAHNAGVIHRDIKPSNLMLTRHPSGDIFVQVIDFGISKLVHDSDLAAPDNAPADARRATRGDVVLGTAPYWCGEEGPRADVYALALTLAVLLTGEVPPVGVRVELPSAIPPKLASVLGAALALGDEIATMDAFDAALREVHDALEPRQAQHERRRYFASAFPDSRVAQPEAGAVDPSITLPRFRDYILCGELGKGGMGHVRIAFDPEGRRRVALKTIQPQHARRESFKARLRREYRALATIDHPGVPRVFEFGSDPEPYFTMEIVTGVPLKAEPKIEPIRALSLAIDLAEILMVAHEAGVVHRDVKPDNILIGKGDRVRLLDFGVCMLLPRYYQRELLLPATPPGERYETGALEGVGTPGYTAPEIMAREGTTTRSDVYSVCAVLYRMLTGRSLVDPRTSTTRPVDAGEFPLALGPVADLLRRGTAREPFGRPRSMADLAAELEILRSGLRRRRAWRRDLLIVMMTVLASVCLVAVVPLLLAPDTAAPPNASDATAAAAIAPVAAAVQNDPEDMPERTRVVPPTTSPSPPETASASAPDTPSAPLRVAAPTTDASPRRPVSLTRAAVEATLKRRRADFDTCRPRYRQLRVRVVDGRAELAEIDAMPYSGVGDDVCLRDGLSRIPFPRVTKPADFVVPLDLRRKEDKAR